LEVFPKLLNSRRLKLNQYLKKAWQKYASAPSQKPLILNNIFSDLCTAYSESHRHYHTLAHVAAMLALLEQREYLSETNFWATWFHDIIYNPLASDNEDRSAGVAEKQLNSLGYKIELIKKVVTLIQATKSHVSTVRLTEQDKAFLDADMSILGTDTETYDKYSANVRKEFNCIPDDAYREGRVKFLSSTLAMPKIFSLESFSKNFESHARINICREISSLNLIA
jgi:predicted metal-dependent HD superfamily phosphohydrolase